MSGSHFITLPVRAGAENYKPASMVLSPAGHYAAATGAGVAGRLWTFAGLTVGSPRLQDLEIEDASAWRSVAFRPHDREEAMPGRSDDYAELSAACNEGVERFGIAGGAAKLRTLELTGATRVAYSHDGSMLAAGTGSGQVVIWHLLGDGPQSLGCNIEVDSCVTALGFTHGGRQIVIGTESGASYVLDGNDNGLQHLDDAYPQVEQSRLYSIGVCQERSLAALCGDDSACQLLNFATGDVRRLRTPNALLSRAEFLHHNCLALYGPSCTQFVDPTSGRVIHEVSGRVLTARQFCRTFAVLLG